MIFNDWVLFYQSLNVRANTGVTRHTQKVSDAQYKMVLVKTEHT